MNARWTKTKSPLANMVGIGPYIDLALETVNGGFYPAEQKKEWISVLVRLTDNFNAKQFAEHPDWKSLVHVPALYTRPIAGLGGQRYCTAYVRREFFDLLKKNGSPRDAISRITFGQSHQEYHPPENHQRSDEKRKPSGVPEPGTVVIGIIDDGIAFAHERFRSCLTKTRVEYIWLQDQLDLSTRSKMAKFSSQTPLPYGRELCKKDIDELIFQATHAGAVDEDEIYREGRAVDFRRDGRKSVARRAAHGTHVMDFACGYNFDAEERADRPIVCVQLPTETTEDTSGATLDDYGLDAIRYILDRADQIAVDRECGSLPVVINLSYGNVAGPHDGTLDFEVAIDELVRERGKTAPLKVVFPSGNSHLLRLHAQVSFSKPNNEPQEQKSKDIATLHWRVLPDDRTPSFLEIWLPKSEPNKSNSSRVRLRIRRPSEGLDNLSKAQLEQRTLGEEDGTGLQWVSQDQVLCEARYRYLPEPTNRGMFLIALQPTTRLTSGPVAPSGTWIVELENVSLGANDLIDAWIQRDDTPFGFRRRGRQSYFDEPSYERFDAQGREIEEDEAQQMRVQIRRAGSINAIATGRETVVVDGFLRKEMRPARYSARGRAAGSPVLHRFGPDAPGFSDDSIVHGGVFAAGTRSGSVVVMRGTSVAAPQITRWIADQLARGDPGDRGALTDITRLPPDGGGWNSTRLPPVVPLRRFEE